MIRLSDVRANSVQYFGEGVMSSVPDGTPHGFGTQHRLSADA